MMGMLQDADGSMALLTVLPSPFYVTGWVGFHSMINHRAFVLAKGIEHGWGWGPRNKCVFFIF